MDGIFISYRRDDSAGYAGRLYDRLVAHFGSERVFMDVEGIEPGTDFVTAIEEAVGSCRVLIVMIGDEWTNAADAGGRRRLDDPHDFIRIETATALQRDIRVVPVLVGGAIMPRADELPPELKPLTRRQAIEINHKQWDASSGELIRTLERILATGEAPGPSSAPRDAVKIPLSSPSADSRSVPQRGPTWRLALAGVLVVAAGSALWFGVARRDAPEPASAPSAPDRAGSVAPAPSDVAAPISRPAPEADAGIVSTPKAVPATPAPSAASSAAGNGAGSGASAKKGPAERPVTKQAAVPRPPAAPTPAPSPVPAPVARLDSPPVAPPAPAPAQKAVAAPGARQAAPPATESPVDAPRAADTGRPLGGERWIYQSRGKWPTSPKRRFEIAVQSVAGEFVTDALRIVEPGTAGGGQVQRSAGGKPGFVEWTEIGAEFSPYWGAFVELSRGEGARGFATPEVGGYWTNWYSVAKVLGEESVSVPAGTFDAYKVEVWSNRNATGGPAQAQLEPVGIHYLIWYAPSAKRYVKMQRRVISASNSENERDVFELVSHRLP